LRAPMRPNPIGVSTVRVRSIENERVFVSAFDAYDGSPILDLKTCVRGRELAELVDTWGRVHDTMVRALEAAFAKDALRDILYAPLYALGCEAAKETKRDARDIGRAIMRFEESWDIQGRVLEDAPGRFVREVTACPWSYFAPLSCRLFAWWMEGYCAAMNDEFAYRLENVIPEGDATCVWSVAAKGKHA